MTSAKTKLLLIALSILLWLLVGWLLAGCSTYRQWDDEHVRTYSVSYHGAKASVSVESAKGYRK